MVNYAPLWETMQRRGVSQYKLIYVHNISAAQISRLKKNMYVSTHTIEMFCKILQCGVEDIMKIELD